jgi:ribosomal protein S18 acetylase RimI-like enzyme
MIVDFEELYKEFNGDRFFKPNLSDDEFEIFHKHLNWFVGYDKRALKYNLKFKYSEQETRKLLQQLSKTKNTSKEIITYKEIEQVPERMWEYFAKAKECSPKWGDEYKLGAFRGYEIVGFLTAKDWKEESKLVINSIYVHSSYRDQQIAVQLVFKTILEAKKRKLVGVDVYKLEPEMKSLLEKLQAKIENQKKPLFIIRFQAEECAGNEWDARITFI